MPPVKKQRKDDQYTWVRQVWSGVITALILAAIVFAWSLPSTYAKQSDLNKQKEDCKTSAEKVDEKLDKILVVVQKLDTRTELQQKDLEHIKEGLLYEIERSKTVDAEHTERLRDR